MKSISANQSISACRTLFDSKYHVAKGILPLLHEEDVKIAFSKKISEIQKGDAPQSRFKTENLAQEINDLYGCSKGVLDYIKVSQKEHVSDKILFAEPIDYRKRVKSGHMSTHTRTHMQNKLDGAGPAYIQNKPEESDGTERKSFFYKGKMLPRKMRLGTYLYYRGIISRHMLIDSLYWQKRQRPLIGQITLQIGMLNLGDFSRILLHTKDGTPFGVVARRNGLMTCSAIDTILSAQKRFGKPLGTFFIERGVLTPKQIDILVNELHLYNARYSDRLQTQPRR